MFYVQEFGNSKGIIVERIHQTDKDVILKMVKNDFVFTVSKKNFSEFYSDFDINGIGRFNQSADLGNIK